MKALNRESETPSEYPAGLIAFWLVMLLVIVVAFIASITTKTNVTPNQPSSKNTPTVRKAD